MAMRDCRAQACCQPVGAAVSLLFTRVQRLEPASRWKTSMVLPVTALPLRVRRCPYTLQPVAGPALPLDPGRRPSAEPGTHAMACRTITLPSTATG